MVRHATACWASLLLLRWGVVWGGGCPTPLRTAVCRRKQQVYLPCFLLACWLPMTHAERQMAVCILQLDHRLCLSTCLLNKHAPHPLVVVAAGVLLLQHTSRRCVGWQQHQGWGSTPQNFTECRVYISMVLCVAAYSAQDQKALCVVLLSPLAGC